jgi:hypothetical protein
MFQNQESRQEIFFKKSGIFIKIRNYKLYSNIAFWGQICVIAGAKIMVVTIKK